MRHFFNTVVNTEKNIKNSDLHLGFFSFNKESLNGSLQSFESGGTITFTEKRCFGNLKIQNDGFKIAVFF